MYTAITQCRSTNFYSVNWQSKNIELADLPRKNEQPWK